MAAVMCECGRRASWCRALDAGYYLARSARLLAWLYAVQWTVLTLTYGWDGRYGA